MFFIFLICLNIPLAFTFQKRPVIGILTQEIDAGIPKPLFNATSYINAAYVKFVESGGAQVVPIWIGKNEAYYRDVMKNINGVLFPGGSSSFDFSKNGYATAGRYIYKIAKEIQDKEKSPFPLWGTCLGMQLMAVISNNGSDFLAPCSAINISMPLQFLRKYSNTKLYSNIAPDLLHKLKSQPLTANFHKHCLNIKDFRKLKLDNTWSIITTNKDKNGMEFVSSFESKNYSFFGVQYHPEKNVFEDNSALNVSRSIEAIQFQQFLSNKFINISRQNSHSFPNEITRNSLLIYNYNPVFTGKYGSTFQQIYYF